MSAKHEKSFRNNESNSINKLPKQDHPLPVVHPVIQLQKTIGNKATESLFHAGMLLQTPPVIQRECLHFVAGWIHPATGERGPAGRWCETLEEAQSRVEASPSQCFIYADGPTTHPYRPIPGWPCAHYVAHELGIRETNRWARCRQGYAVTIGQIIIGRTEHLITEAQVGDIYLYPGRGHSGVVRAVNNSTHRVLIEACGIGGGTYRQWVTDGSVYR